MPRLLTHPYFVLQSSEFVQELLLLIRSINKREKNGSLVFFINPWPRLVLRLPALVSPTVQRFLSSFRCGPELRPCPDPKTQNIIFL
jgi:hypothetical protein